MSEDYTIYKTGKVVDGELQGISRQKLKAELGYFNGKPVELIIRKRKKHRSNQQNKYYWVLISIISDHLGYDRDTIHEIVKYKFLKKESVDNNTGEVYEYVCSTTKLSTVEFLEYVENIIRWSAETFSIVLPLPNEQIEIELNKI